VHAGDALYSTVTIINRQPHPKTLIQAIDPCPDMALVTDSTSKQSSPQIAIANIAGRSRYRWSYKAIAPHRGIFSWPGITLRTAAPFGLTWHCRFCHAPARMTVYPSVIALSRCRMLDGLAGAGPQEQPSAGRQQPTSSTSAGLIRSLRPYRWGDPMRLVHWRSSARYGELRSRELEDTLNHRQITIALDQADWKPSEFEQAVTVAASLIQYAVDRHLVVQLWTISTGTIANPTAMMEILAQIHSGAREALSPERSSFELGGSYVGLTADLIGFSDQIGQEASQRCQRWLLWPGAASPSATAAGTGGPRVARVTSMQPNQPLQPQIQQ
ncbi:MAG: DUF58 domain-containing protein, partial [Elainellaceae cyanobacterium]